MPKPKKESKNLGLGVRFIFVVILLLLISAAFKAIDIVKNSAFDKTNFYILVKGSGGFNEIVISPSSNQVTLLSYKTSDKSLYKAALPYNLISDSSHEISKNNLKSEFPKILSRANANPLDFIKLSSIVFQSSGISSYTILSEDQASVKEIPQIISDPKISSENLSIEIANATGISGVGNIFAKMIGYLGGNIVLVSTSNKLEETSKIITVQKDSLTNQALVKMFDLKYIESKPPLSDIKIIIGKDLLRKINL